jgi:integrase
MGIKALGENRFRVQIRRKGFPAFDRVFPSRPEANAAMDAALANMKNPQGSAEDMTLSAAWETYRLSSDFHEKSNNTQKTEEGRIKAVLASLGWYSLANLAAHPRMVWNYLDERSRHVSEKTGCKLSRTSLRLELAALSSVAAWAVNRQLILRNFVNDVKRPGLSKRKRRVPPVEHGKLELAAQHVEEPKLAQAARFLLLLRFLGCRPGELAALLRADIRFGKRDLTFRDTKYKSEDRLVHSTELAMGLLNSQYYYALESVPESPYLFSTESRKKDDTGNVIYRPYNYACGIKSLRSENIVGKDFHAHAMRREYISRAIESGLPYATIRKQTGHHSTQAIEIYDEGLSTAPEIRKALDEHEHSVDRERFEGLLEAYGMSKEAVQKIIVSLDGEKKSPISRGYANGESVSISIGKQKKR